MHDDEIPFDLATARALVAEVFPRWAGLPIEPVATDGTDNWMMRLGADMALRAPRRPSAVPLLKKEWDWLRGMQDLPLAVPAPLARSLQAETFGHPVNVVRWIEGEPAQIDRLSDPLAAARMLADALRGLQRLPIQGAPLAGDANNMRGVALAAMDARTRPAMAACSGEMDLAGAEALWAAALSADPWPGPPVWLHGDLKADNLLARDGALVAVLDWGLSAVGDPAADYACAWSWLPDVARGGFLERCGASEADVARARGWALYGAVIALSYYRGGRNEALCNTCRATLRALGLR